ncbi:MAG: hypothetical protein IJY79_04250, partial [Clostridia bacterium]|nr:hypothetical protein [Clostridia bacterium]
NVGNGFIHSVKIVGKADTETRCRRISSKQCFDFIWTKVQISSAQRGDFIKIRNPRKLSSELNLKNFTSFV